MNIRKLLKTIPGAQKLKAWVSSPTNQIGTKNMQTRHEWMVKTLASLPPGSRILDAGAGEQQYKKFCNHLTYVSQDFAQYQPTELKCGMQMPNWDYGKLDIISDITSIPEADGSFDVVMCIEVLEHVPDPVKAINELSRLVRKGGTLIISAPFCSLTHFAPYHYSTGFSRFFYDKHLHNNGFTIVELSNNGNYFEYVAQELRRIPQISQQYSHATPSRREKKAITTTLNMLNRLNITNQGSEELLVFGFHIIARKN
jgi:ubiquinone/menaquinone biosynthesis C-methylase UbiE